MKENIKRGLFLCIAFMVCFMGIVQKANAADTVTYTDALPVVTVRYDEHYEMKPGQIRYISQGAEVDGYWTGISRNQALTECTTTVFSMALSYVGVEVTPGAFLTDSYVNSNTQKGLESAAPWNKKYGVEWITIKNSTDLNTAVKNYINGKGKYSPVCVRINSYVSSNRHEIMIIGKIEGGENTYRVLDPNINTNVSSGRVYNIQIKGNTIYSEKWTQDMVFDNSFRQCYRASADAYEYCQNHTYNQYDICTQENCGSIPDYCGAKSVTSNGVVWNPSYDISCAGWYVTDVDTAYLRVTPYDGSPYHTPAPGKGTEIYVTGSVKNRAGHLWYRVSYDNKIYYVYSERLKKSTKTAQAWFDNSDDVYLSGPQTYKLDKIIYSTYPIRQIDAYEVNKSTSVYYATTTTGFVNQGSVNYFSIKGTALDNNLPCSKFGASSDNPIRFVIYDTRGNTLSVQFTIHVGSGSGGTGGNYDVSKLKNPLFTTIDDYGGKWLVAWNQNLGYEMAYRPEYISTYQYTTKDKEDNIFFIDRAGTTKIYCYASYDPAHCSGVTSNQVVTVEQTEVPSILTWDTATGTHVSFQPAAGAPRILYTLNGTDWIIYEEEDILLTKSTTITVKAADWGKAYSQDVVKKITPRVLADPGITVVDRQENVQVGDTAVFSWKKDGLATSYILRAYYGENAQVIKELETTEDSISYTFDREGVHVFRIMAIADNGSLESQSSVSFSVLPAESVQEGWSAWMSELPANLAADVKVEEKIQYRGQGKRLDVITNTTGTAPAGYTLLETNSVFEDNWHQASAQVYESSTRQVKSDTVLDYYKTQYRYGRHAGAGTYHFCLLDGRNQYGGTWRLEYSDWMDTPIAKYAANPVAGSHSADHTAQGCYCPYAATIYRYKNNASDSPYYWEETRQVPVYKTVWYYKDKVTSYTYGKWISGSWSAWQDEKLEPAEDGSYAVETRKLYRYQLVHEHGSECEPVVVSTVTSAFETGKLDLAVTVRMCKEYLAESYSLARVKLGEEAVYDIVGERNLNDSGLIVYTIEIPAQQIDDAVTLIVGGNFGGEHTVAGSCSLGSLLRSVLEDESRAELHDKAKSLLNYGGYAQTYFRPEAEETVNKDLYEEGEDPVQTEDFAELYEAADDVIHDMVGVAFLGTSLTCNDTLGMNVFFTLTDEYDEERDMELYAEITDNDTGVIYDCRLSCSDGLVKVEIPNINPAAFRDRFCIAVVGTKEYPGESWAYVRPLNYMRKSIQQTEDEDLKNLIKSMYLKCTEF